MENYSVILSFGGLFGIGFFNEIFRIRGFSLVFRDNEVFESNEADTEKRLIGEENREDRFTARFLPSNKIFMCLVCLCM